MKKFTKQDGMSLNVVEQNIASLKNIFPETFTEDKIDFEVLRQLLGDKIAESEEKFCLNWFGKKKARQIALTPSTGTLRPCPEESIDWDTTQNLFIEGDNLEVLKLLQRSYSGKIKMIYIDPPYNKDKDFVYPDKYKDNLQTYLRYTGQIDEEGFKTTTEVDIAGRNHSKWINMMYPRIKISRSLLKQDGAIFISIDDNEVHALKAVCNEIFGEENFVSCIVWQKSKKGDSKLIAQVHDYILCYAKDKNLCISDGGWRTRKEGVDDVLEYYKNIRKKHKNDHLEIREEMMSWYRSLNDSDPRKNHKHYNWSDERGLYFAADFAGPDDGRESRPRHDILHPTTGKSCKKPSTGWRWDEARTIMALNDAPPRIHFGPDETTIPNRKSYLSETAYEPFSSHFYQDGRSATLQVENILEPGVFTFPKNTNVLQKLIELTTKSGDIVMDFFAGSGSFAHACIDASIKDDVELRYIIIQLPEKLDPQKKENKAAYSFCKNLKILPTISSICLERLRRVSLAAKNEETTGKDLGFKVFKLDSSNIVSWNPDQADIEKSIISHTEHLVPGRTEEDILYELLLKRGVELTAPIEEKEVAGKTVYSIGCGALLACLDMKIKRDHIEKLGQGIVEWHKELAPTSETQAVFRDNAFENDVVKTNITAILEQGGIKHVRSL